MSWPPHKSQASHANLPTHERVSVPHLDGSYRCINSVANSSRCRNSKALRATRSRSCLAWNESRRLQLRVWKGCRPLSSSLKIPPWGFPLGSCGHYGTSRRARPDSYMEISRAALFRADTRVSCVHVLRAHVSWNRMESAACNLYPCEAATKSSA